MYQVSHFTENDPARLVSFIKKNPFAVIVAAGGQYPVATHLPMTVDLPSGEGKIRLRGHLMRNTDHHRAFKKDPGVLVIFNGPHAYVSASWYNNPQGASTWNYMTVHARGQLQFTDDAGTYQAIQDITGQYEGPHSKASFDRLPNEYVQQNLKAIVGFAIEIESLEGVFKLSQNRSEEDQANVIRNLEMKGDPQSSAMAAAMRRAVS